MGDGRWWVWVMVGALWVIRCHGGWWLVVPSSMDGTCSCT